MSVETNKKVSLKYHDLRVEDIDDILTSDFVGHHAGGGGTWDFASHKQFWTNNEATDTVHEQFGEGDKICTRFTRSMKLNGKDITVDGLHIKIFRDGKIAEIWEFGDTDELRRQTAE